MPTIRNTLPSRGLLKDPKRLAPLLLAVLALLLWWGWPRSVRHLQPRPGPIVALGDSLTAGVGSETRRGFIAVLSSRLGVDIVNKGVPGDTTRGGLDRLEKDVLQLQPALVLVELGGNDFLQQRPLEETFSQLRQIVQRIQAQGTPVLLIGVQSGLFGNKAGKHYKALARELKTGFVPNLMSGIMTQADLKADAIHPNDLGYEKVADRVEPELRWMLRKMQRL